jgi:phosphoglycolate phosphatase-like HAD superfamily hydrolase
LPEPRQPAATPVAVFDFDQTIAETNALRGWRDARDWTECARRAPNMPFYPGMEAAFAELSRAGLEVVVASSAPDGYLKAFLERLPSGAISGIRGYRKSAGIAGLSYRAAIKVAHLNEISRQYVDRPLVFVGDDADDADAAQRLGVPFIHACWGGPCAGIPGEHVGEVDGLFDAILRQSGI